MSRSTLYSQVIGLYKQLYKTRFQVFTDDNQTLKKSLDRLRNDFRMNKDKTDEKEIKKLIKVGKDVNRLLRSSLYQTVKSEKENTFRIRVKPYMLNDNETIKK